MSALLHPANPATLAPDAAPHPRNEPREAGRGVCLGGGGGGGGASCSGQTPSTCGRTPEAGTSSGTETGGGGRGEVDGGMRMGAARVAPAARRVLAEAGLLGAAAGLEASGPRGTLTKADALRAAAAAPDSRGQG